MISKHLGQKVRFNIGVAPKLIVRTKPEQIFAGNVNIARNI